MTNAWLQAKGVLSLKTLWAELAQLPYADPHVRWCGESGQKWPLLPDFVRYYELIVDYRKDWTYGSVAFSVSDLSVASRFMIF